MKTYKIIILFLLLVFLNCKSKSNLQALKVNEFNWTVTIPENFKPMSKEQLHKIMSKGIDAVESSVGHEVENQPKTIFTYQNGKLNSFAANWNPFDVKVNKEYFKASSKMKKILYQIIEARMPQVKFDSVSSIQKISGLQFHRFDILMNFPNGIKMTNISFSRLFGEKELTVNMSFVDGKIGQTMLDTFLNSKFK